MIKKCTPVAHMQCIQERLQRMSPRRWSSVIRRSVASVWRSHRPRPNSARPGPREGHPGASGHTNRGSAVMLAFKMQAVVKGFGRVQPNISRDHPRSTWEQCQHLRLESNCSGLSCLWAMSDLWIKNSNLRFVQCHTVLWHSYWIAIKIKVQFLTQENIRVKQSRFASMLCPAESLGGCSMRGQAMRNDLA